MSYVQQQIIDMAPQLSDSAADAVYKVMSTFIMLENKKNTGISEKRQAYLRLKKMVGGFPADFDPEREITEAREAKYGTLD